MSAKEPLQYINLRNPVHLLALGFGSGLMRTAPGTWGTVVGLILGVSLLSCLNTVYFLVLTSFCFILGCFLCQKTAHDMGVHDHGTIVWDEIVGIFLVLTALPELSWFWCLTAFVIFRLFDIGKPYPIRHFDRNLQSGFGIMIDDILAAGYSIIVIFIIRWMS